jgi:prepilin-type N-terminal cleavage/methylation domain-containing protein
MIMRHTLKKMKTMDSRGFTMIEVLISMAITVIVMGAVFGLLTRGQRTFEREPEVADLQQSARNALDMVSKDVLQAGSGLPPEFPSFTPRAVDPVVGDQGDAPDIIEIIGAIQTPGEMHFDPVEIEGFNGTAGIMRTGATSLAMGDLVAIYNDDGIDSKWALRFIDDVPLINTASDPADSTVTLSFNVTFGGTTIPEAYSRYDVDFNGLITRVSVIRYSSVLEGTDLILRRQVDFGQPMPVGTIYDFQVVYLIGTQNQVEQVDPPHPQPAPGFAITAANMVSGVRITVAARSASERLAGAETLDEGVYIRKAFSSNVSPRNIINGLAARTGGIGAN